MPEEPEFVPARYIGGHIVDLQQTGRDWRNIDGSKRTELRLGNGDTVMMPAEEVIGKTLFSDKVTGQTFYLGLGRVVKVEHQEIPQEQLTALGYEFHEGRPDFETTEAPKATRIKQQKTAQSIEVDASQIIEEEVK